MGNSETKKMRARLASELRLTNDQAHTLLPPKAPLTHAKITTSKGKPCSVYIVDNDPILFETDAGLLLPTVYAIWKCSFFKLVSAPPLAVQKLLNGANLYIPGLILNDTRLSPDDVVAVCTTSDVAIMVGISLIQSDKITNVLEGTAIANYHTIGDKLWEMGSRLDPRLNINSQTQSTSVNGDWVLLDTEDSVMSLVSMSNGYGTESVAHTIEDNDLETLRLSPAEMDQVLLECALSAVFSNKLADPLGIPSSAFFSRMMLPFRPDGVDMNIKHSSFKKLSKFLKHLEKIRLISCKERAGELYVVRFNHKHEMLIDYTPITMSHNPTQTKLAKHDDLTLKMLYRYPKVGKLGKLDFGFGSEPIEKSRVKDVLSKYILLNELALDGGLVHINPFLCDAILAPQEYTVITSLSRAVILERFTERMEHLFQLGDGELQKGEFVPMAIKVFKKNNKKHTSISGFEIFGIDPVTLRHDLKHKCAASCSSTST